MTKAATNAGKAPLRSPSLNTRLLRAARPGRLLLGLAIVLGIASGAATIVQWAAFAQLVAGAFLHGRTLSELQGPLLRLVAAISVRVILGWGRTVSAQAAATRIVIALRGQLLNHLLCLGPGWLRGVQTGAVVATATGGLDRLEPYYARFLPQVVIAQLVPLLLVAAIWPRDWLSAALLLFTAPILPLLMVLVGDYTKERVDTHWLALTRLKAAFLDSIQGLTTTRTLGADALGQARVARQSETFRVRTMQTLRYAFLSGLVLELLTSLAIALLAVTLGMRLLSGTIGFETAFFVLLLAPEFYRPLRDLGTDHHAGMEGRAAAASIFALLDQPAPPLPAQPATLPPIASSAGLTLTLADLRYTYPESEQPALHGINLTFAPGERVAIVGPSGAGKSTLINLLLGFLSPDSGTIIANGVASTACTPAAWRSQIALVPQRPYLFATSALENLRLARPSATFAEIQAAAAMAAAADFIAALPAGYDTLIGERGARLSQGQAQRLAIARALLQAAPLLIIDEPTAHLDAASEAAVRLALEQLPPTCTVLMVTHHLATARLAERIIVLDGGKVVEDGSHQTLCACGGTYARLLHATASAALVVAP